MGQRIRPWAVALLVSAAWAAGSSAQPIQNLVLRNSFNPIGAGARGLGMGGAFIAVADDGTAASFNPAGLAQLRRTELALVGFHGSLRSDTLFPRDGRTDSSTSKHGALDFAGLSVPFEVGGRNMTVQLSYQRSVDLFGEGAVRLQDLVPAGDLLGSDLADTRTALARIPGLRTTLTASTPISVSSSSDERSPISQSGAFHTGGVSLAYQATQRLAIGASFNFWKASWTASGIKRLDVNIPGALGSGGAALPLYSESSDFEQQHSMTAFSLNSGFLLRYPKVSIGGVLRLPFSGDYDLEETVEERLNVLGALVTTAPGINPAQLVALPATTTDTAFGSRLRWPRSGGVGIALRPISGLTLAADYSRAQWSRAVIEDVPAGALFTPAPATDAETGDEGEVTYSDRSFFDLAAAAQTGTLDTSAWRVGGEYLVSLPWVVVPLRGGYYQDESPIGQLTGGPREIEGWTAGTGLNFNRIVIDVAFERRKSEGAVSLFVGRGQGAVNAEAPVETVRDDRVVASVMYRFGGDDDPVKRLFRALFVGPKEE